MGNMDVAEVEESVFAICDAKLHRSMCEKLSSMVCKVMAIFPKVEEARPRCKSGIQSLCSLHVALEKAKGLLRHCSECSKLYLAITGESVLMKFDKVKFALEQSLRHVEDIVPQSIGCQIMDIVNELESTAFSLDLVEKQVGEDVIALLQQDKNSNDDCSDTSELEAFHQAASRLGITSSKAALTERRALKKLLDRARSEDDKRKESIVSYLLHLMRKYSKIFRNDCGDDCDSQGSSPCSPTVQGSLEERKRSMHVFDRDLSKLASFNLKVGVKRTGQMPVIPEEFRCPISLQLMYDPVIISSGQTYEKICIEKWFSNGHDTCPKTQQKLSHLCVTPNYCVKGLIASWCEQNGVVPPDCPPVAFDLDNCRSASSKHEATNTELVKILETTCFKEPKVVPLEDSGTYELTEKYEEDKDGVEEDSSSENSTTDAAERCDQLLSALSSTLDLKTKCRAAEQVRFLLKDDEEARSYMGENGFVDALVGFLRESVHERNDKAQETAAMALFNLTVNNRRNAVMVFHTGVLTLLEEVQNSSSFEAATALYLNLSCLDEAKEIIGSSAAVPFLVGHLRQPKTQCKCDALHTIYNLSTLPKNIPRLLATGVVGNLARILSGGERWAEKVIAVLCNLAASRQGRTQIGMFPGLVSSLSTSLDSGTLIEQEQAASCLLVLCVGDERCSHLVLQEGVIPSLVSMSMNGTTRGKDKAKKLLMHFREQREREPDHVTTMSPNTTTQIPRGRSFMNLQQQAMPPTTRESSKQLGKPLNKSMTTTRKLRRTLSAIWKSKVF